MELIREAHNLRPQHQGSVVTIGNFDGVHRGHQAVIGRLVQEARYHQLPGVLITFEPLPREYFMGAGSPARLTSLRDRLRLFAELGVDRVLLLRFDQRLANLEPEAFIQQILVDGLATKTVIVGDDFHYGKDRAGNFESLVAAGIQFKFQVLRQKTFLFNGERVSSTHIRECLARGNLAEARDSLGRAYAISGRVRHGDARGRLLGFPTANIALSPGEPAVRGVFAVEIQLTSGYLAHGVANVGNRPTVDGANSLLEAHLFEFTGNLYGEHLYIEFKQKIRDERRFPGLDELTRQIRQDVDLAQAALNNTA